MAVIPTPVPIDIYPALFKGVISSFPMIANILMATWYIWIIVPIIVGFRFVSALYHYHILSKAGIQEIDKMSGTDFELFLTSLFSRLGYKTEHVGHAGDYGVDVIAERDGTKIAIQAKKYKDKVGEDAVREAFSGMNMYKCTKAIVVTNSFFTPMAKKLAKSDNVELWDRYDLAKSIMLANKLDAKR